MVFLLLCYVAIIADLQNGIIPGIKIPPKNRTRRELKIIYSSAPGV